MNKIVDIKQVEWTPLQAEDFLRKHNTRNRKHSQRVIDKYAAQMKAGEWIEATGDTIKLSKTKVLIDGQHRLAAQVKANVTLKWLLVEGLPDEAYEVVDTQKPRRAADALYVLGAKNHNYLATLLRGYLLLKAGVFEAKAGRTVYNSNTRIIDLYNENTKKWDSLTDRSIEFYFASKRIIKQGFIGPWYAFLNDYEPDEALIFFNKLCFGTGLMDINDPIYVLRNILLDEKNSDKRLTAGIKNAYFIITWNYNLTGRKYKKIPFIYGKSKFPILYKTKREAMEALGDI